MKQLKVGYAAVNIDPPLGIGVHGYYVPRFAKGFLDHLEASALVLSCGKKPVVLISVDNEGITAQLGSAYCAAIEKKTGIPAKNVFLSATHTHTGPLVEPTDFFEADPEPIEIYSDFLQQRLADLVTLALADLKPARMGFAVGRAPDRIAYIRRYRMKDGSTLTCPPINDPEIQHPIGELDQRVNVLRFDQNGGGSIVLLNYGLHADTVGGEMICSDWLGWLRRTVEKSLDGTKCICFVGAQGDVGSTHIHPDGGDLNDTEISFDNEMKSPGMARFIGRALAGTVLQVYDKVKYIGVDAVEILRKKISVSANTPDPEDLPLAHRYKDLHETDQDDVIPYTAMELTTVVAEAMRMCRLEHGPDHFELELTGVRIGNVAMIGIPGEPFTEIGVQIKDTEGWSVIMPCCLTNGNEGYFPTREAFEEGGYEARSSNYRADVFDEIIRGSKDLLWELKQVQP